MGETVLVPGGRDVRATLDAGDADRIVVACPSHPQMGGSRTDGRLRAVSEALSAGRSPAKRPSGEREVDRRETSEWRAGEAREPSDPRGEPQVATLRFDYGEWDEGYGELADARNALSWARERYDHVGLFGFSFGGCIALLAASGGDEGGGPRAVSALAPVARLQPDLDATEALADIECPVQIVYGERDDTAEWQPVVERSRELGHRVESISADHFFVGQAEKVAGVVAGFLREEI